MTSPAPSRLPDSATPATSPGRPVTAIGWAGWLLVALALMTGLAAGAWATNYWLGHQLEAASQQKQQILQTTIDRLRIDLAGAQARADGLAGQQIVHASTIQGLEAALQKAQAELGTERDKVAFYEQLMPPGPKGAITVRALEFDRRGSIVHYRAVLMRNAQQQQPFKGRLQFVANGTMQGKKVTLDLVHARSAPVNGLPAGSQASGANNEGDAAADLFDVSFEQFQRSSGMLRLPDGFLPLEITLNILEGDTLRASSTVKLQGVTAN